MSLLILPHELLSRIFLDTLHLTPHVQTKSRPEFFFAHISQYCRTVTLSTPLLWTNVRVSLAQLDGRRDDALEMVVGYFARSKICPLKVILSNGRWASDPDEESLDALTAFLTILLPHAHRLQSFAIEIMSYGAWHTICDVLRRHLGPQIESLHISIAPMRFGVPTPLEYSPLVHKGLPRLSHLRLSGRHEPRLPLQLEHVTCLDIGFTFWPYPIFRSIILATPRLSHLILRNEAFPATQNPPIDVPSLRILTLVAGEDCDYAADVLITLNMLNLEKLELVSADSCPLNNFWDPLFIEGPEYPSVKTVSFSSLVFMPGMHSKFLRQFPNVTHLKIMDSDLQGILNFSMTDTSLLHGVDILCPALSTVTLHTSIAMDMEPLLLFIRARIASRNPLERLRLSHEALESFSEEIKGGLRLIVDVEEFSVDGEEEVRWLGGSSETERCWWE
ncbi:hypothetical protein JAAARDRAFT_38452 [Jaapia argillacea MUCL 33604]|uniref:F-box domain-containing protein n=1 Tax=Jaapia argillacea MUCL 33604 TaxID=933084 RepID=A0A067PHK5_9AGAM|nr:hypothetical protein JAAARDRAFT_38452 [Jaapia argillacea MUCL 33604]